MPFATRRLDDATPPLSPIEGMSVRRELDAGAMAALQNRSVEEISALRQQVLVMVVLAISAFFCAPVTVTTTSESENAACESVMSAVTDPPPVTVTACRFGS